MTSSITGELSGAKCNSLLLEDFRAGVENWPRELKMKVPRISIFPLVLSSAIMITGCHAGDNSMSKKNEGSLESAPELNFSCVQELTKVPARDPDADQLYKNARWLVKRNILKEDPAEYPKIERLLRIAAAHGHDRANIELRDMLQQGQATSADLVSEIVDLVQELVDRQIPAGYYDMGWHLEHGYGVRADAESALIYYRKSADMGSPEGQYLVGMKLADERENGAKISAIGWSMLECAARQGHVKAAEIVGASLQLKRQINDSMAIFQSGAMSGSSISALTLADAFSEEQHADPVWGLGQAADAERQRRYKRIQKFLSDYSYLNPKVPEINDIVPLPPAKLPPWDGSFKWLKEHEANVPPPLPSEARIVEMAKAKGLDPKTGRRLTSKT